MSQTTFDRMDISEYRKVIREVMQETRSDARAKPRVLSNRGPAHARVVLQTMFEFADAQVRVNSGSLSDDAFDLDAVSRFLACPNATMAVLVDDVDAAMSDRSILPALRRAFPDPAKLDVRVRAGDDLRFRHFTVMDGRDLRLESDHDARVADVFFNHPERARMAEDLFDKIAANSAALEA
jgi:hypothetical protein